MEKLDTPLHHQEKEKEQIHQLPFQSNPIMSYGVIAFNERGQLLSVCRLYSIGYCEFLNQCKHNNPLRILHFRRVFRQMTYTEKLDVLQENPESIFTKHPCLRTELLQSIENDPKYAQPEWGFPKGRKNSKEEALKCAIREFNEETGLAHYSSIHLSRPIHVFHEVFLGSNFRIYQHQYYLFPLFGMEHISFSLFHRGGNTISQRDSSEISQVAWMNIKDLHKLERPYYRHRNLLFQEISEFIHPYLVKYFANLKPPSQPKVCTSISSIGWPIFGECPSSLRAKNKQKSKKNHSTSPSFPSHKKKAQPRILDDLPSGYLRS